MINGTSEDAFRDSVRLMAAGLGRSEALRLKQAVIVLLSEAMRAAPDADPRTQLHGLSADEVLARAEGMRRPEEVVETGEAGGVRFTLFAPRSDDPGPV